MEKVVRPFDRRLPDAAGIMHQHYNLLVRRNPELKEWMVRAPMVAHLRPANLRDFLVRKKIASSKQRTRGKKRRSTGVQKVLESLLLVLRLLFQHEDAHQHLDRPDLANQTEHHL